MGLRLYQPPVESDIPHKPTAEKRAAEARTLHRTRRGARVSRTSAGRASRPAAYHDARDGARVLPAVARPAQARQALRDMASRLGYVDLEPLGTIGRPRSPHLSDAGVDSRAYAAALRREGPGDMHGGPDLAPMPPIIMDNDLHLFRDSQLTPPPGTHERMRMRAFDSLSGPFPAPTATSREAPVMRTDAAGRPTLRSPVQSSIQSAAADIEGRRLRAQQLLQRRRPTGRSTRQRGSLEAAQLDGLGDRNRSISPEADTVWDTLLTTITPDPQPPSVGSSFASASASASASARASQQSAANSSGTSLTEPDPDPDTADDSTYEPVCESGCDLSDSDDAEFEELLQIDRDRRIHRGFLPPVYRTYADVTATTSASGLAPASGRGAAAGSEDHDPLEMLGGLGGMQRIVRSLSAREDIPDEWWAEAGLSRTLSREPST